MPEKADGELRVRVNGNGRRIVKAEFFFTRAAGFWPDRKWNSAQAQVAEDGCSVTAKLPRCTTAAYFNVIDDRGSRWSSRTWGDLSSLKDDTL
jgi:hypothetical protein